MHVVSLPASSHSYLTLQKGSNVISQDSLCRVGNTSQGTRNLGFSMLGMICLPQSIPACWDKTVLYSCQFCAFHQHVPSPAHQHKFLISFIYIRWSFLGGKLHSVSSPGHSVIITGKRACYRSASYACKGFLCLYANKVLKGSTVV